MIIQAELRRKQSEYEGEACSVDKVIELPAQRFKQFSRALLADYDFIVENKNAIRRDDDARHCLLILDAEGTDGFLVDPQGYNCARYSAFVPNARLWRQGQQSETVVIHHIVSVGTIDEDIMKVLENKDKTQAAMMSAVKARVK